MDSVLPSAIAERLRPFSSKLDDMLSSEGKAQQSQRMALTAFTVRIVSAAIAYLSQVAMARLMGLDEYGVFVLVWVAMVIIGSLSCLGMQTAVIRFLPQYRDAGDLDRLRGLLLTSRLFIFISSSVVALLVLAAVHWGSEYFESAYIVPFTIAAFGLPMLSLADALEGTARANAWGLRALLPTYIVRPLLILLFLMLAWAMGYTINGVTGVICAVAATYMTTIAQLYFITRDVDRTFPRGPKRTEIREWLVVALPIFLVEGFFFLLVNADVLMVGRYMQSADVGIYYATVRTLALVHFVFFAVKAGTAHHFSSLMGSGDQESLKKLALQSTFWTFWPSLAMGVFILLAGPLLLGLFGHEFKEGYPLLFILISGVVIRSAIGPAESLLNMSGNQAACAAIFAGVLAVNISLNALFIPIYGLKGAAIATFLATLVEVFALFQLVRARIGINMSVLSYHMREKR